MPLEVALALCVVLGAWCADLVVSGTRVATASVVLVVAAGGLAASIRFRSLVFVFVALVGFGRGVVEWSVEPARLGPVRGVATLVDDPDPTEHGTHLVFEVAGRRVDAWLHGRFARRIERVAAGERVVVVGEIVPSRDTRRSLLKHVVGRLEVDDLRITNESASHLHRSVNRVRRLLEHGTESLADRDRALLSGLLYGDDRAQSDDQVAEFRAAGLAHLTAVSGQNVAYVLAVASPLLVRLSRRTRMIVAGALLVAFAFLTRAEPSVIRASLMAATSLVASRDSRRSLRSLGVAIAVGVAVDPFLVWSVGWWLSVSGCAGLVLVSPLVERALGGGRVARWVAPTLGAQLGVLPVSTLVFGLPHAVSPVANLLAGPVAGLVMFAGLPLVVFAAIEPFGVAPAVLWPVGLAVRWIAGVAARSSQLVTPYWIDLAVPAVVVAVVVVRSHWLTRVATWTRGRLSPARLR